MFAQEIAIKLTCLVPGGEGSGVPCRERAPEVVTLLSDSHENGEDLSFILRRIEMQPEFQGHGPGPLLVWNQNTWTRAGQSHSGDEFRTVGMKQIEASAIAFHPLGSWWAKVRRGPHAFH